MAIVTVMERRASPARLVKALWNLTRAVAAIRGHAPALD